MIPPTTSYPLNPEKSFDTIVIGAGIAGLTAGHWAFSPGGSPVAVLTGKLAAEAVLKS